MILLENEYLKVTFSRKGAELKDLVRKENHMELMWSGDPFYWAKSSPILFPIVGALKDNTYFYQNKRYELPRHGFARDMEFSAEKISAGEVLFTLESDENTLINYPFAFKLGIRYKIEGTALFCTYEVHNPGAGDLLFSIGGHPAFAVPLELTEEYTDCFLQFDKDEVLEFHKIQDNLIDDQVSVIPLTDGKLNLEHSLFYEDALVFKQLKSKEISLRSKKSVHGLSFTFEGFPYFGIWAAKDANFVCLEPWCGIADGIHHDQQLENKEGIVRLPSGESWARSWNVQSF